MQGVSKEPLIHKHNESAASAGDHLSEDDVMTTRDHLENVCAFLLMGTAALYFWNSVLNTLYSVVLWRYAQFTWLGDVVTASYATVAFLSALALSHSGSLQGAGARLSSNAIGGLGLALLCFLWPVAAIETSGKGGAAFLVIIGCLAAVMEMLFQCSGFALAVILPRPYAGWVSWGYGICGVMTFLIWMILSQGIFKISSVDATEADLRGAVWVHFVLATLLILASVIAFWRLSRKNAKYLLKARGEHEVTSILAQTPIHHTPDDSDGSQPERAIASAKSEQASYSSVMSIFMQSWYLQLAFAFHIGLSMMAYPNIGPYGWGLSIRRNDVLTGVFQVGDFLGRFIPNIPLITWPLIPTKFLMPLTLVRVVLLALFIVIKKRGTEASLLSSFGSQVVLMAALALSHGWYASVYMIRIPEALKTPSDKARASSLAVSLLVFAIAVGLWLAKLV